MTDPDPVAALAGPATAAAVSGWLSGVEADQLSGVTAAVNAVVRRWVPVPPDGQEWPADITQGAVMLAGRLWRRRNSPAGVETFGAEGAAYVQRNDPDLALLLRLGPYAAPAVG